MIQSEEEAKAWLRTAAEVDATAMQALELLAEMLADESARQNLISAASLKQLWQRHIADSAQLLCHVPRETPGPWLDLGTGGGFPGLAIAILRPDCEVRMVESRALRCAWLERAKEALDLQNATIAHCPIERYDAPPAAVISARAFAPLDRLLKLSARFSTSETIWLLPKGRSAQQELNSLRGWSHMFHVEQSLTDPAAGLIVGKLAGRKGR